MPSVDFTFANHKVDPEVLTQYYQRLFPARYLFQWLNHSPVPSSDFTNREFAFTLFKDEKYIRYLSYPNADAFKKDLLKMTPSRFEIGPEYNSNPRDRRLVNKNNFKTLSKELVFDIDLTDYDGIRTCCSDKNICELCWNFITFSIHVLDETLREDFGFEHILWVYSGRRGAHAWVCDKRARELDDKARKAMIGYLNIAKGTRGKVIDAKRPFHPYVSRMFDVATKDFTQHILLDQDPWRTPEDAEKLLKRIPDLNLKDALKKKWGFSDISSSTKWKDIDEVAKSGNIKTLNANSLLEAKKDIILEYMYPRLDVNVSVHMNHLLKSPFCVHPGTGRVCVPITDPDTFDASSVPTLNELLEELSTSTSTDSNAHAYESTSLKPYIDFFGKFVNNLMKAEQQHAKRGRENDLSF
ncbi:DNA primase subunit PRI1 [Sugiyamaella lignohabitans]|uniref:DNA primase n=1 Tax=Sugiyamaella lignohabitans TaxID=796027 RepID=A0A167D753_9ASCO|nr:DNA primase subunit PRI1 [Sugiyamaella lignohabitans]ANB12564.1 DNA primase subunit PRI1 [Sugiyamaella lignohabitans]